MARSKKTIRDKLVQQYVALSALVILLFSSFCLFAVQNSYHEQNQSALEQSTERISSELSSRLSLFGRFCSMLSQNSTTIELLIQPWPVYEQVQMLNLYIEPNIHFFLLHYPAIESITVYSDFENQKIPSSFFRDIAEIRDLDWYQQTLSQFQTHWHSENGTLYVSNKIYDYVGSRVLGIIQFEISAQALVDGISTLNEGTNITVTNTATAETIFTNEANNYNHSHYKLLEHEIPLDSYDLSIHGSTLEKTLLPQFLLFSLPALIVILLACIVSVVLIRHFSASITRRINTVTAAINQISRHDFDISIPVAPLRHRDELDELANCLNIMSQEIKKLILEVEESKSKEMEANLQTMQAKINPHFLYNILDSVGWYALRSNNPDIHELTKLLAIYYRTNLNDGMLLTTVENELENSRAYVKLQQYMSNNSFDVQYCIDEKLLNVPICNFILQPLIENAILHGIKALDDRRGQITISVTENQGHLILTVADNGYGMSKELLSTIMDHQSHNYGIKNVQQRIQLHYGKDYGLSITSELDSGTTAAIVLPMPPESRA